MSDCNDHNRASDEEDEEEEGSDMLDVQIRTTVA